MAQKYTYYTQEGYDKMKGELTELKTKGRSDMSKQIAEARDKGDLSENAEYDAAKDAQGMLEMRISDLSAKMNDARVLDESMIDMTKVSILSTVKIKNQGTGMEMTYTLVPEEEADLKAAKISVGTPIAVGLLGKTIGDVVEVTVPVGVMKLEILEIGR